MKIVLALSAALVLVVTTASSLSLFAAGSPLSSSTMTGRPSAATIIAEIRGEAQAQADTDCPLAGRHGATCPMNRSAPGGALDNSRQDDCLGGITEETSWLNSWNPTSGTTHLSVFDASFLNASTTRMTHTDPGNPDQISLQAEVFKNFRDWRVLNPPNATKYRAGLRISDSMQETYYSFFNTSASFVSAYQAHQSLHVTLASGVNPVKDIPLNSNFIRAVKHMSAYGKYNRRIAEAVLEGWGTQMATEVRFGAVAHQSSAVKSCVFKNAMPVADFARLALRKSLYPGRYTQHMNTSYTNHTRVGTTVLTGGNQRSLTSPGAWVNDTKAMSRCPALIEIVDSVPIPQIVAARLNATLAEWLQQAIDEQVAEAWDEYNAVVSQAATDRENRDQHVTAVFQLSTDPWVASNYTVAADSTLSVPMPYENPPFLNCFRGRNGTEELRASFAGGVKGPIVTSGCSIVDWASAPPGPLRGFCCRSCLPALTNDGTFECECPGF